MGRGTFLPDGRFVCATRLPIFDSSVGLEASTGIPVPDDGQLWVFRESRGDLQVSMWLGDGVVPDHCLARDRSPLAEFLTGHESCFWITMGEIVNQPLKLVDPHVALNREITRQLGERIHCFYKLKAITGIPVNVFEEGWDDTYLTVTRPGMATLSVDDVAKLAEED